MKNVTEGFKMFIDETEGVGETFMKAVMKQASESCLDKKVHELAYISVLVAEGMNGGLPFHIKRAKSLGASYDEVKSAILVPMPVIGIKVAEALPFLKSYNVE